MTYKNEKISITLEEQEVHDFWNIIMELGNISSGNIFITSNHHDDIIYYYNDNYI